jgi:hypothetical protein
MERMCAIGRNSFIIHPNLPIFYSLTFLKLGDTPRGEHVLKELCGMPLHVPLV